MIGWKRKWCTVNREFCEDGEVVRWRAIGHREGRCKRRIGRGDHKVEDMILVVSCGTLVTVCACLVVVRVTMITTTSVDIYSIIHILFTDAFSAK